MAMDPRFKKESGLEVFNGNELLIKGCLETEGGVHLYSGYPGSPVASFFDILGDIGPLLKEHGIRAFQANNEALGVAALNGSQMAQLRGIVAMKSVGVHVASDALAIGNLAGAHPEGGAICICGDDPWCDSTQVPADSRFLLEHLRMAVVEPGDIQQLKDWIDLSFKLSRAAGLYIGYVATTAQADGGGTVVCRPNQFSSVNTQQRLALESAKVDLGKVLLPPRTWQQELKMPERHQVTIRAARELGLNKIIPATRGTGRVAPIGFILTGMCQPYLQQVLADVGLTGVFPVLQMGMQYPTDVELVREFAGVAQKMIVIEERRSFLEKNIRDRMFVEFGREEASHLSSRLFGKQFPGPGNSVTPGIPETRGLNPSVLAELILPLIQRTQEIPADMRNGNISSELERIRATGRRTASLSVIGSVKAEPVETPEADTHDDHMSAAETSDAPLSFDNDERLASRTPTFCPGCPHRDSSATLLEIRRNLSDPQYMHRVHKREPVDLIAHGDTGCYTMLMYPPTEQLMHNYSGMGLGGGTGSGIDPFISNKQIVFMGDGTFFHSGQIAISNAIKAGQDICFIILENKTTAMTGHQEHAGTELDVTGNRSYIQQIHEIVLGMRGTSPMTVERIDPANRTAYKKLLEATILRDGVKVLIADKECGITYHRRKGKAERNVFKEKGYLPKKTHMNITPEVCEGCLECTKATACPGLIPADTDYGQKIDTDLTWCVNDGACARVRTSNEYGTSMQPCPSFEEITVLRNKRKKYKLPKMDLAQLPEAETVKPLKNIGDSWRVHLSGVGGMGIGVVGGILVRAGQREGYTVRFAEKKGLAIRNGGVYAQIAFAKGSIDEGDALESTTTGHISYGKADLLLGIDVLEAARAVDPREAFRIATPDRTAAVLNLHKQPTVGLLIGQSDFDPEKMKERIYKQCNADLSYARNLSDLCEKRLGSKQYVNMMLIGVAYQLGLIPVSAHSIAWSIKDSIRRDQRSNMKAFNIGRKLALEPRALLNRPEPTTWEQLLTQKTRLLRKYNLFGEQSARRLELMVKSAIQKMPGLNDRSKYDLAIRIYDLMQYENTAFATRFVDLVRSVYRRDSADQKYQATHAAIWSIAKVMLIKDEPYVAYLLTRPEKYLRDMAKYEVDESNGDRMVYKRKNVPEFNLFGKKIKLTVRPYTWQYRTLAKMTFLRKLPGWHKRESAFRDWLISLLDRFDLGTQEGYQQAVRIMTDTMGVTGYREVRFPKEDRMKQSTEAELSRRAIVTPPPTQGRGEPARSDR